MSFSDVFKSSFLESIESFTAADLAVGMTFAVVISLFIFWVYKKTFTGIMYSPGFSLTLIGLCLVTTLVIMAVTSNVVLSLGMVGALSIVRFRAAIKDPMEIVFLFWSIAVGIVIGAGMIPLALTGSVVIGIILMIFANRKQVGIPYIIIIDCDSDAAEKSATEAVKSAVSKYVPKSKKVNAAGIELTAQVRLKDEKTEFVNGISNIEGVRNATLVSYNGEYAG
ncbi:MAG: DUF4956 domain-containing protein [Lachnospiraceae bacterium]|nr:DUF4956 domain-containing protein [Lachnospiraceae bacterium]